MVEFPHKAPKDYFYEYEQFAAHILRIMLCCRKKFDYNLGSPTKTVWGFYCLNKKTYYAPINSKKIGKKVDIEDTSPYTAMQIKQTLLESFFA